jgi:hypothetical protein
MKKFLKRDKEPENQPDPEIVGAIEVLRQAVQSGQILTAFGSGVAYLIINGIDCRTASPLGWAPDTQQLRVEAGFPKILSTKQLNALNLQRAESAVAESQKILTEAADRLARSTALAAELRQKSKIGEV